MKRLIAVAGAIMMLALSAVAMPAAQAVDTGSFDSYTALDYPNNFTDDYESVVTITYEYTYEQGVADVEKLLEKYPDKIKKVHLGYSELGREIFAITMGEDDAESRALFKAGAHAREYISCLTSIRWIEHYCANWDNEINGEKFSDLVKRCQFVFVPMNNPDGQNLVIQGLDSLNVILNEDEKAERAAFLTALMQQMNRKVATNWAEQDTEWIPPGEGEYDFQYWKGNINGVDDHYNYWSQQMLDWLLAGSYLIQPANSSYYVDQKPYYMNYMDSEPLSQAEVKAVADYALEKDFNIAITVHTLGSIYQWNYGFLKDENGTEAQTWARGISQRFADYMMHTLSTGYSAHIGFNGWYRYERPWAYCANIELAARDYFLNVEGYEKWANDASPVKIEQFTTDLVTKTGVNKYSIWTKHKFTPIYMAQYLLNNQLVPPAGEATYREAGFGSSYIQQTTPVTGEVDKTPATATAIPTPSKIMVDGVETAFEAYNIDGNNFFKLRDLAYALNGTPKQFSVEWDEARNAISLASGGGYMTVGGELENSGLTGEIVATKTTARLYLDDVTLGFAAYNIGGNNYYKLRDIAGAIDFGVEWDAENSVVSIVTSQRYTE